MTSSKKAWVLCSVLGMSLVTGQVFAQQVETDAQTEQPTAQSQKDRDGVQREKAVKAPKPNHRYSTIAETAVRTADGERVGRITDLAIDLRNGQIKYAAVSIGGFLGIGDKLVAVNPDQLTLTHGEQGQYFSFDGNADHLKNANGFAEDRWPNEAENLSDNAEADQQNSDRQETKKNQAQRVKQVYRASELTSMPVRNLEGDELGSISDLMVNLKNNRVQYAALSVGGVLGLGDKMFAVPMKAMILKKEQDNEFFLLDATPELLEQMQGFDQNAWPNKAMSFEQEAKQNKNSES
ncbi:Hypothetical protein PBC10988_27990 [Planctomycetales bacterium 10988]|nr:Hypothetical protein PBC10988_27990 [Planctomycetales bacterium 10988]